MILASTAAEGLRLKFCSDITFVDYALEIIRAVAAYQGIQDPTDLLIVSHELLKNAVVHGNRNDRAKNVLYELTHLGGERYRVVAQDGGDGFDRRGITAEATGTEASRGTGGGAGGLQIVRSLTETVRFSRKGSRISVLMRV